MKKYFFLIIFISLIACKKDDETLEVNTINVTNTDEITIVKSWNVENVIYNDQSLSESDTYKCVIETGVFTFKASGYYQTTSDCENPGIIRDSTYTITNDSIFMNERHGYIHELTNTTLTLDLIDSLYVTMNGEVVSSQPITYRYEFSAK